MDELAPDPPPFASVDDAHERLERAGYLAERDVAVVTFLAGKLGRSLLLEGPPGSGKTELAKAVARATGRELVRLQCYEGLDEARTLYEWEYAKQLLYAQVLREHVGSLVGEVGSMREAVERVGAEQDAFFSERFLLARPLLRAIRSEQPVVLLIDEIDRADPELEAFLLEVLSDWQVTIPELGTFAARHTPFVVLTSNATRELTEALRRRCLHMFLDYPTPSRELRIVRLHAPEAAERLAEDVVRIAREVRAMDVRKPPSISETIDWARAICLLGAQSLDREVARATLGVLMKHREDEARVAESIDRLLPSAER